MNMVMKAATQEKLRETMSRMPMPGLGACTLDAYFAELRVEYRQLICALLQEHRHGPDGIKEKAMQVACLALGLYQIIEKENTECSRKQSQQ